MKQIVVAAFVMSSVVACTAAKTPTPREELTQHIDYLKGNRAYSDELRNLRYDIRTTDSIVSPLIATIEFERLEGRAEDGKFDDQYFVQLTLRHTDGEWTLESLSEKEGDTVKGRLNEAAALVTGRHPAPSMWVEASRDTPSFRLAQSALGLGPSKILLELQKQNRQSQD